jgi:hypothetical protein
MRVRHYLAVAQGKPQESVSLINPRRACLLTQPTNMWQIQLEAQAAAKANEVIQSILADINGAVKYIIDGKDKHPNRLDQEIKGPNLQPSQQTNAFGAFQYGSARFCVWQARLWPTRSDIYIRPSLCFRQALTTWFRSGFCCWWRRLSIWTALESGAELWIRPAIRGRWRCLSIWTAFCTRQWCIGIRSTFCSWCWCISIQTAFCSRTEYRFRPALTNGSKACFRTVIFWTIISASLRTSFQARLWPSKWNR